MAQDAKLAPALREWKAKRSGAGISISGFDSRHNAIKIQTREIDVQGGLITATAADRTIWLLGMLR